MNESREDVASTGSRCFTARFMNAIYHCPTKNNEVEKLAGATFSTSVSPYVSCLTRAQQLTDKYKGKIFVKLSFVYKV